MKGSPGTPSAQPFFLQTDYGKRFCLYHEPHEGAAYRAALIYIPPFGEEMNKSRRMAALQARAFAANGIGVLQMDLFGCGDSSGEFADARWDVWKRDVDYALGWLNDRTAVPIGLWGLRLGALLTLDIARERQHALDKIVLWQPIVNGASFLTQFLRLQLANEMLANDGDTAKTSGTRAMRDALANGETLEIAGYALAPDLAAAIDELKASEFVIARKPIHWFEIVSEAGRPMSSAGLKVADAWKRNAVELHVHLVPGLPFWATQEISECAPLIAATTEVVAGEIP
ncbi:hydrolase 2, exosortase A system-associated [Nitrosovibrio sp. Nv17]|uniref:hydrolase 2, exosortase A system-associated n=1 Tax=Nitrosovibrio sp. Nv17 TaxID=1855339 RepID=UPI00090894C1|nr:hydrolase 2, exosortase A system-associated [Nitrosovibrio sp. Nv17]SFW29935.1 exosortase A system-associated hydrolase 2 [Nitrosovibrio sp. Nv17]